MTLEDKSKQAFEFASDTSKQLITLATGITALTITFSKDVVGQTGIEAKNLLVWSWLVFLVSILFGVWSLLALTRSVASSKSPDAGTPLFGPNIRVPVGLQVVTFVTGLALTVAFGVRAI